MPEIATNDVFGLVSVYSIPAGESIAGPDVRGFVRPGRTGCAVPVELPGPPLPSGSSQQRFKFATGSAEDDFRGTEAVVKGFFEEGQAAEVGVREVNGAERL